MSQSSSSKKSSTSSCSTSREGQKLFTVRGQSSSSTSSSSKSKVESDLNLESKSKDKDKIKISGAGTSSTSSSRKGHSRGQSQEVDQENDPDPDSDKSFVDLAERFLRLKEREEMHEKNYQNHHQIQKPEPGPNRMTVSFDGNGNLLDDEQDGFDGEKEPTSDEDQDHDPYVMDIYDDDEEPKYFINAAGLDDEDEFIYVDEKHEIDTSGQEKEPELEKLFEKSLMKFRVPQSQSYPENIIQNTLDDFCAEVVQDQDQDDEENDNDNDEYPHDHGHGNTMSKENSDEIDSLVAADSLEDLNHNDHDPLLQFSAYDHEQFINQILDKTKKSDSFIIEKPQIFHQYHHLNHGNHRGRGIGGPGLDLLSQSTLSTGLFGQKPPESWVIDLNSLSLEDHMRNEGRRSEGSNPNSLAFFVNIDPQTNDEKVAQDELPPADKKIFSMFVDFDKKADQETCTGTGHGHGHKNPMVLSSCSYSSENSADLRKKRYASSPAPSLTQSGILLQNKAQVRKIALNKIQAEKNETEKSEKSLEKSGDSSNCLHLSNRSSLHVAPIDSSSIFANSQLLSSMENSVPEGFETSGFANLGKDLLRMFEESISTDVNISVSGGRTVKAHKCILASRSQYFAAILSGNWVERAGNRISLDRFSYNVVYFTMHHIYSGTNEIPDSIDLLELATITDLLGLEGLRENISQTIRVKYCHNFHRPCTGCISGVLECYHIALAYGMEDLQRKMTKWICKHFVRIWSTKAFANLGDEFIEKCLRYSVNHLSPENVLDIVLGCDQLLSTMPSVRWTEPIFSIVNQLSDSAIQYIGENLSQILTSQRFLQFGKGQSWNISRIEGALTQGLLLLKPDEACLSHNALVRLIDLGVHTIDEVQWSGTFVDFLKLLRQEIERYLISNAGRAVLSKNWETLDANCRKRICSSSFLGFDKSGTKKVAKTPSDNGPSSIVNSNKNNKKITGSSTSGTSGKPPNQRVASVKPIQNVYPSTQPNVQNQNFSSGQTGKTGQGQGVQKAPQSPIPTKNQPKMSRNSTIQSDSKPGTPTRETISQLSHGHGHVTVTGTGLSKSSLKSTTTRTRHAAGSTSTKDPPPVSEKSTKFLTNSEKAKLVSRPTSTASSTRCRSSINQSDISISRPGSSASLAAGQLQSPSNEKPSKKPSSDGFSRRESTLSLQEKRVRNSTIGGGKQRENSFTSSRGQGVKPSPLSVYNPSSTNKKPSSANANLQGQSRSNYAGNNGRPSNNSTPTPVTVRAKSTPTPGRKTPNSSIKTAISSTKSTISSNAKKKPENCQNADNDNDRDMLMTKSNYESDSGEPKLRTLAEIGRSSTFSKEEPTIPTLNIPSI